jgi:Cof subfamily protein (haloacid dehalogenase superfamily)
VINANRVALFAVDLDDTLLDKQWCVSERNRGALSALVASGVEVCIISGRMPDSMRRIVEPLEFVNYIGSYHGAIVEQLRGKRIIASRPVPLPGLVEILDWKGANDYRCIYFVGEHALAEADDDVVAYYRQRTGATVIFPDDPVSLISNAEVSKIILYDPREPYVKNCESSSEAKLCEEARQLNFSGMRCFQTGLGYIEFTNAEATKESAVRSLCSVLEIPLAATAAIGDSYNDLDMLATVGMSFAVSNAVADIRDVANHVVGDNNADGVANAVDILLRHNRRTLGRD